MVTDDGSIEPVLMGSTTGFMKMTALLHDRAIFFEIMGGVLLKVR